METAIPIRNPSFLFFNPFPKSSTLINHLPPCNSTSGSPFPHASLAFNSRRNFCAHSRARRRAGNDDDEEEEFGYNEEMALLESYTESVKDEVLIVHAAVDDEEVEVVVFKGFSSCLSYGTTSDPARSVIPARAVIRSVDRVKGPLDPSNVDYIQRGLAFDDIKTLLLSK